MDFISPDAEIMLIERVFTEVDRPFALPKRLFAQVATVPAKQKQEFTPLERAFALADCRKNDLPSLLSLPSLPSL